MPDVTLTDNILFDASRDSFTWSINRTFYYGGAGIPAQARDSLDATAHKLTDRIEINTQMTIVFLENITLFDDPGFIANDTLRKLLADSIILRDYFIDIINDLLDVGTGSIEAILTDAGRALFTRFVLGEITFDLPEFRVGREGYDATNFLQTVTVDPTAAELGDQVITDQIINGDFNGNLIGWNDISQVFGGDGAIAFHTDHMDLIANTDIARAEQPLTTVPSALYELEFDVAGSGSPAVGVRIGTTSTTEPGGGAQIHTTTHGTGTIKIGFVATTVQTWIGFTNNNAASTYTIDNVKCFRVFDIQQIETPTPSTLAFLCRLGLNDANFGLGELGIWSQIKSSTTDANEVDTKVLFAIAHHPVWAKTARNTIVHRIILQI